MASYQYIYVMKGLNKTFPGGKQDPEDLGDDRRTAIREAIAAPTGPGAPALVLIAGKGHEKVQEISGSKIPFDDVSEGFEALSDLARELDLPMRFDGDTIAAATGGQLLQPGEAGPILTDTRKDLHGAWFLALVGARFDGHAYLEQAVQAGAVGVVVSEVPPGALDAGVVLVDDTTAAMATRSMARVGSHDARLAFLRLRSCSTSQMPSTASTPSRIWKMRSWPSCTGPSVPLTSLSRRVAWRNQGMASASMA